MSASPPRAGRANRDLKAAVAFLLPNFLGFLVFTAGPVLFSLVVAFSNWDLMKSVPFQWTGLDNFREMFGDQDFWLYFINTGYLMLGMPLAIAGSLGLALLLTQRLRGIVVFRTMYYLPTFTAGVALLILWKSLYSPDFGPINRAIESVADGLAWAGGTWPGWIFVGGSLALLAASTLVLLRTARGIWRGVRGGEIGPVGTVLALPAAVPTLWVAWEMTELGWARWVSLAGAAGLVVLLKAAGRGRGKGSRITSDRAGLLEGAGRAFWTALGSSVLQCALLALALLLSALAAGAAEGVQGPQWLVSTKNLLGLQVEQVGVSGKDWGLGAREALIFMGIWIGIGGNNMLLYIAALSNVPQELYEAAQIDGAGKWQMFSNVTWPQLAPTTFFIVVMSCIGGLQGGFQQARVMTQGGPAGTTTTLAYYIYTKAFQEFQIAYASAVAWVLFSIIFVVTLLNWKFGAKELNY